MQLCQEIVWRLQIAEFPRDEELGLQFGERTLGVTKELAGTRLVLVELAPSAMLLGTDTAAGRICAASPSNSSLGKVWAAR